MKFGCSGEGTNDTVALQAYSLLLPPDAEGTREVEVRRRRGLVSPLLAGCGRMSSPPSAPSHLLMRVL